VRKYAMTFRIALQNALLYRGNLAAGFITYAMFIFVFLYLWTAIYEGGGVEELTLTQVVWYLCVTEIISFGANTRVYATVAEDVKSGAIAYQLLRPYGYIGYQFASAMGLAVVNILLFGAVGILLGSLFVGPIPSYALWTLLPAMLSLLLGVSLYFFVQLLIGLSAFFIEDPYGINLLFGKFVLMFGTFIPIEFLPDWLTAIARKMPFSYVSWAPARLFVGYSRELFFQAVPMQLMYLSLFMALCALCLAAGRRRVQANGG
jgi:ABC-2 type transport system permease protein